MWSFYVAQCMLLSELLTVENVYGIASAIVMALTREWAVAGGIEQHFIELYDAMETKDELIRYIGQKYGDRVMRSFVAWRATYALCPYAYLAEVITYVLPDYEPLRETGQHLMWLNQLADRIAWFAPNPIARTGKALLDIACLEDAFMGRPQDSNPLYIEGPKRF